MASEIKSYPCELYGTKLALITDSGKVRVLCSDYRNLASSPEDPCIPHFLDSLIILSPRKCSVELKCLEENKGVKL